MGVTAADISACDREPIHIPGTIQPHGILLALDPKDLTVTQAAGDTERLLGVGHANLIGNNLGTILGSESLEQIRAIITDAPAVPWPMFGFETVIERPGKIIEAIVHVSDGIVVLELEPLVGAAIANPLSLVQGIIMRLQHRLELDAFLQGIAEEVRAATGFERVMIYKFLPDDSGAVVAESRGTNIGPYLGLHYPASDIPKQARALYLRNWLRLIPDARYTPAPIVPAINPLTNKPLDLSHSALRSVSPVHLEYLANMGVTASMSLSLVVEGRLWGLIACHDREPKHLPHSLRAACELLAQLISLQLADKLAKSEQAELLRTKIVHAKLVEALLSKETLAAALIEGEPNVNDYIPSSGALVWWDGKISRRGDTPNDAEVAGLVDWLNRDTGGVLVTDCLAKNYPPAAAFAEKASGLIALSISRSPRDYVLWFRREVLATVHWAGDPNKPVEPGQGDRLNPRSSFAAWKEIVRGCSDAWPDYARDLAEALRSSILEVVLRWMDEVARERDKMQARQDFLLAELDHRVKNTLATIQSLVRYSASKAESLEDFVGTVQQRLGAMARTHERLTESAWRGGDLRTMIKDEIAPYGGETRVTIAGEDIMLKPRAALCIGMAVHELVTNAAKYGALSTAKGRVEIAWGESGAGAERQLRLDWIERGGPPVEPPTRAGFGRTVLERTLAFELGGDVELRFAPQGVRCSAAIPIEEVVP